VVKNQEFCTFCTIQHDLIFLCVRINNGWDESQEDIENESFFGM
jgi:hypothetical protein